MMQINSTLLTESQLLSLTKAPGAQYILVDQNRIIKECNAGYADLLTKSPVNENTSFNNFSVTKTATAAAILQLVEQNKILLSDYVNPLFNQFHFKYPFTLQQLVSHQAGFVDPIPISWIHLTDNENKFDEHQFITKTIDKYSKQNFIPGTKFSYSSIGYLLLSQIIEKISGLDYVSYIKQNIISPSQGNGALGFSIQDPQIHATGYHPRYSFSNLLLGCFFSRKEFIQYNYDQWLAFRNFYVNGKAYGGFIGNARGLTSYLQSYLKNKLFNNSELQKFMFSEQKGGMAMGWFTGQLNGQKYVCHAGGGGGYYCEIRIYPELKMASALLRNRSSFSDLRLLDNIDIHFIS